MRTTLSTNATASAGFTVETMFQRGQNHAMDNVPSVFTAHSFGTRASDDPRTLHRPYDRPARLAPSSWRMRTTRLREFFGVPTRLEKGRTVEGTWLYSELEMRWQALAGMRNDWFEQRARRALLAIMLFHGLNLAGLVYGFQHPGSSTSSVMGRIAVSAIALGLGYVTNYGHTPRSIRDPHSYLALHAPELNAALPTLTGNGLVSPTDMARDLSTMMHSDGRWMINATAGLVASGGFGGLPANWILDRDDEFWADMERLGYRTWFTEQNFGVIEDETFHALLPGFEGTLDELVAVTRSLS